LVAETYAATFSSPIFGGAAQGGSSDPAGGGGALLTRVPRRMYLVTNLVAHVAMSGSPFDELFTGAALDAAAGGTAAVQPTVNNISPQFRMGRIKLWRGGRTRFARFSSWPDRASASLRYFRRFSLPCWLISFITVHVLCVVRWNLHCTSLPVTPDS
jgi:hypothetical protein